LAGCELFLGLDPALFAENYAETCSDGLDNDEDGATDCQQVSCADFCSCGDGILQAAGEACDDGNLQDGDGCNAICVVEFCGDGVVNDNGAEACDDGNVLNGDGCNVDCTLSACENGIIEAGELCLSLAGSFSVAQALDITAGDLNGDGKDELLLALGGSLLVGFLDDTGNATFEVLDIKSNLVRLGNFDGDGKQDAAIVATDANLVGLFSGDGARGFTFQKNIDLSLAGGPFATFALHTADLTGDGIDEIAALSLQPSLLQTVNPKGNGSFLPSVTTNGAVSLDSADMDADGDLDLVLSSFTDLQFVTNQLAENNTLPSLSIPAVDGPFVVRLGVITDDALPGLAMQTEVQGLQIFHNDGPGNGVSFHFGDPNSRSNDLALGDMNSDGTPDIMTASGVLFLNQQGINYLPQAIFDVPSTRVVVADLNGDSVPDAAFYDVLSDQLFLLVSRP
jgi:cysteine-rich repeat protein